MPPKATIRKIKSTKSKRAPRRKTPRPTSCGNGTVPINGACVPVELGFQLNQSISKNPINNYAEIQGMLASKTVLDDTVTIGNIARFVTDGVLYTEIERRKQGDRQAAPLPSEWLWIKE